MTSGLVGGHCISVDPYYLIQKAEVYGILPRVMLNARKLNDSMGAYVANQVVKCVFCGLAFALTGFFAKATMSILAVFTSGGNDSIHVSAGASGSIVQGGAGNDSYSYGRAGGRVSLFDNYSEWDGAESSFAGVDKRYHAGNDTLIMRDLSREQVVMRLSGDDLEIGIKEEGKAFSGLSDVLTIKNWRNPNNRIETIRFRLGRRSGGCSGE